MPYLQGDIVEVSFDPTLGHEPAKTRPTLVVSADDFNLMSSMTVVVPITSVDNGYPLHVEVEADGGEVHGFACVEQLRALDLVARRTRKVAQATGASMSNVLNVVGSVFGI